MISDEIKNILKRAVKDLYNIGLEDVPLEHPREESHGDYSSNIALAIFSKAKGKRQKAEMGSALEVAKQIKNKLQPSDFSFLTSIEAAPPGFINFRLSEKFLKNETHKVVDGGDAYGTSKEGRAKTVIVEYSSPNVAKRFGIGHLRSTIIGQALYNMYKALGWKVIGENHLGDWGTQFGMLIASLKIKNKKSKVKNLTVDELEEMYVGFNRKAQEDPALVDEARVWFKRLEDGDKEARKIWKTVVDASLKEFNRIYDILGVEIENAHGESFYEDKMVEVIEDAKKKGLAKRSDGALIVEVPGFNVPLMLLKSDGATTYETRDLAAVKWRVKTWSPGLIIYEVGADQAFHFQRVFAAAEMLGYAKREQLVHVKHGLYRLPEGKMRTRYGKTIKLEDILNEAIERAKKLAEGKLDVSRAVGIGAVKYFDLSHNPSSDIVFNWEKMFVLEGNSAPYLQYTHARARSVLRRANFQFPISNFQLNSKSSNSKLEIDWKLVTGDWKLNEEEFAVLRTLYKFPEIVKESAYSYSPNLMCSYLFDLASRFNSFYNRHRILDSEEIASSAYNKHSILEADSLSARSGRLALTVAVAQIIQNGLNLLGIETPERM